MSVALGDCEIITYIFSCGMSFCLSYCPEPPSLEDHCKARRYAPVVEHATPTTMSFQNDKMWISNSIHDFLQTFKKEGC